MSDLIDLLSRFNRKERFFLVSQALSNEGGTKGFSLDPCFREKLSREIGVEVPDTALAWMDYHLDWIAASLWAHRKPGYLDTIFPNPDQRVVTGTQRDIDLLIAFKTGDDHHLVLLEAKGYDDWDNRQLAKKSRQLKEIFGPHGDKHPNVKPYFCLSSPEQSKNPEYRGLACMDAARRHRPLLLAEVGPAISSNARHALQLRREVFEGRHLLLHMQEVAPKTLRPIDAQRDPVEAGSRTS